MVNKIGIVQDFSKESAMSPKIIEEYVRQQDKKSKAGPSKKILQYQGDNQHILLGELDKLCSYIGERESITAEDVEKVCLVVVEAKYWDLTQYILEQNADKALQILDNLIKQNEAPHKLFAIIIGQFRTILNIKMPNKITLLLQNIFKNSARIDKLLNNRNLPTYKMFRNFCSHQYNV